MRARPGQQSRVDRSFERLYRKHATDVYRYALGVLSNPADAEDVTQTAFLNAYRAFDGGQRPERPLAWLLAIAHNVCRQRFRHKASRPSEVALDEDVGDELVEDEAPRAAEIRVALGQLAFNQRAALIMRELEGRSYAEIAEVLGLSLSAVETLIFRARRALREQLEGTFTCTEAEAAISRQLDGALARDEKRALRAHLRACQECASLARRWRAQRSALKGALVVPLPSSLAGLFGAGGAAVGASASAAALGGAFKVAAIGAAALLVGTGGYEAVKHGVRHAKPVADAPAVTRPTRRSPVRVVHPAAVVRHDRPAYSPPSYPLGVSDPRPKRPREAHHQAKRAVVSTVTVATPQREQHIAVHGHTPASVLHAHARKHPSTHVPPGQAKRSRDTPQREEPPKTHGKAHPSPPKTEEAAAPDRGHSHPRSEQPATPEPSQTDGQTSDLGRPHDHQRQGAGGGGGKGR